VPFFAPARVRRSRIIATASSPLVLSIGLSADLTVRLNAASGRVVLAGFDRNVLRLRRARSNDTAILRTFQITKERYGLNVRCMALPRGVVVPEGRLMLAHRWHGDVLLIDLTRIQGSP